jgi:hypothetical protein
MPRLMAERFTIDRQVFDEQTEYNIRASARRTQKEVAEVAADLAKIVAALVSETLDELMDALDAQLQIFQDTEYPSACRLQISGRALELEDTTSQQIVEQTVQQILVAVRSQYNSDMAA